MHSLTYVLVPPQGNILPHVDAVLHEHNSQWDWYVIGGRWDGELTGAAPKSDLYDHQIEGNVIDASSLVSDPQLSTKLPAVVAMTDAWLENQDDGVNWLAQVRDILRMQPHHRVVAVDTHN